MTTKTIIPIISFFIFIIIILFFNQIHYVENEGFNPSDDGVILAQSFRLLNGEIPHKDFISIRPVFSGILHTIHFSHILPLQISARYFVILEYFVYSFIWIYILIFALFKNVKFTKNKYLIYFSLSLFVFFLNMGNYNLFPWTTIDALFITSLGLFFYIKLFDKKINQKSKLFFLSLALFILSLASLTRQNFVLLTALFFIFSTAYFFTKKQFKSTIITCVLGGSPFVIYTIYLFYNNAFALFISQMTGRTELFQTGIKQYISSFINVNLFAFNLFILLYIVFIFYKTKFRKQNSEISALNQHQLSAIIVVSIYFILSIIFSFYHFTVSKIDIMTVPFELFWISVIVLIIRLIYHKNLSPISSFIYITTIAVAWTSSISLGDNSPVFFTGTLFGLITIISISLILDYYPKIILPRINFVPYILIPVLFAFIYMAINSQTKLNYRDLSSNKLNFNLNIFKDFGNIKTNKNTFNYHKNLLHIFDSLPDIKNNFVVIPNAATMYPALNSKNPFPLDWLQPAEFIGQEDYLIEQITEVLRTKKMYILVDKINAKKMSNRLENKDYKENIILPIIKKYATEIKSINNKFFTVYKTN